MPDYQIPVFDERGKHRVDYVEGQDMMAWVTQGPITDRTVEHLGRSDATLIARRKVHLRELRALAEHIHRLAMFLQQLGQMPGHQR